MRRRNPRPEGKVSKFFGLPVEIVKEPIFGWRGWCFHEGKIGSLTAPVDWDGPVMTTTIQKNGRLAPVALNNKAVFSEGGRGDYGVYCYKTPTAYLVKCARKYHGLRVHGLVEIPGPNTQVIEHRYGYRAQKIVIRHLWISDPLFSEFSSQMERVYDCEVSKIRYNSLPFADSRTLELALFREQAKELYPQYCRREDG